MPDKDPGQQVTAAIASSTSGEVSVVVKAGYCSKEKRYQLAGQKAERGAEAKAEATVQGKLWEDRLNTTYQNGSLCAWVSSFHRDHLSCQLADTVPYHGSYNAGLKFIFGDDTVWLLRFPRVGQVHDDYADEKVAMEVAAINLIRRDTTIPVPKIEAWGVASQNPLGLGPFLIMEFIGGGISLDDLFKDVHGGTRLVRDDLTDTEIATIYRQFTNFLLQLFKLDFDHIGSLDSPRPELHFPVRPLTWKVHDILQSGGVNTFGERSRGFTSTTEYFQYVAEQDWEQLVHQTSSTYDQYDAMAKYRSFKALQSVIPDYVHREYDRSKFKLICDDLGLANLMVRSRNDLTIIGVVDLEWSYIGPAQLFGSAPWWLLMDRPTNQVWDCHDGEPVQITNRYIRYLDMFKRILEEEEAKTPGYENHELSRLVRWSEDSGAMWLHMLLSTGFNGPDSFPFTRLIQHIGEGEWEKRKREASDDEVAAFGAKKLRQLEQYNQDLEKIEAHIALVKEGKMKKEAFLTTYAPRSLPTMPPKGLC
ncbi:hypothetical protein ACEQ8H_000189 [Pleosporales sp. CAS-2024a]